MSHDSQSPDNQTSAQGLFETTQDATDTTADTATDSAVSSAAGSTVSSAVSSAVSSTVGSATSDPAAAPRHRVVIIDGHALAFRSYYAIRELTNSKGARTNAVYGFMRSLLRILQDEGERDATVVTFDAPAKTFRHEQYADYKAGRAPTPEDLPAQIDTIKKVVALLGLYQIEVPGLEADDLFGTIASKAAKAGYSVEIVTSDRDAYQLISEHICVRGLDKRDRLMPDDVFEKYGVRVEQWIDYRSLTGDSSDNIPGAKGIGPVTAKKLLQRYTSLDYILEHLDEVEPPKVAAKIRASLEDVKQSRHLSTIIIDADIDLDVTNWADRQLDADGLTALLQELEFTSITAELGLAEQHHTQQHPAQQHHYDTIAWKDAFFGTLGYVLSDGNPLLAELNELAVANAQTVASTQDEAAMLEHLTATEVINAVDAKRLCVYARQHGIACLPGDDPLLMGYVLDPTNPQIDTLANREGAGTWGKDAASRATVSAQLLNSLGSKLTGDQRQLYDTIERPLAAVLVDMEHVGVRLDVPFLQAQAERLAGDLARLETNVRDIAADDNLNLNSRDQLATLLYDKLGLKAGKKTSTGKRSTAVSALEPLKDEHEVVQFILDYRELAKLKSTYLDPLPKLVHPDTGRLHTTFNQTVVATGRLSSANPNLQNIPIRTEIGRQIRQGFIAAEGHMLLVADYSQIELRILAHMAQEPALVTAFQNGEDIHRRTAAEVYGVIPADVDGQMRRTAKIINFGVLYGMSAHRLTRELEIPYDDADAFIKTYFARYPNVQGYIDKTLEHAREHGYVETLLGRRRPIPDINAKNRNQREYAERTAYNMPIQGTAADIMKLAMIALHPKLKDHAAKLLLQVHDEIIVEAPKDAADAVSKVMQTTMQDAYALDVPLVADVGAGQNWLEAK
jgi:DNA polymerase-1